MLETGPEGAPQSRSSTSETYVKVSSTLATSTPYLHLFLQGMARSFMNISVIAVRYNQHSYDNVTNAVPMKGD